MNDPSSKWVTRNIRAGSPPKGPEELSLPEFRRDHRQRRSSRPFLTRSRRQRHRRNKKIGGRLVMAAVLAACVTLVVALVFLLKLQSVDDGLDPTAGWTTFSPFSSVYDGPAPIIHNPTEIVEHFLGATTPEELKAVCRKDDNSPQILAERSGEVLQWLKGHREWRPLHEAKANGLLFTVFAVAHITKPPRPVYVVQTPKGAKIDIAAFLGWSSPPWEDLVNGKATHAAIVRASATRVGYYNYRFTNDRIYQSYQLTSFGGGPSLYGYVLRGTPAAVALEKLVPEHSSFPVILSLDSGEPGSPHRQFRITHVLAAGWVMGPETLEDHLPQLVDDPSLLIKIPGKGSGLPFAGKNANQ